jgi:hypothetical protein
MSYDFVIIALNITKICRESQKPNNDNASSKNQLTIEDINTILKNMEMRLKVESILFGD